MLIWTLTASASPSDRAFLRQLYLDYHRLMYATAAVYVQSPEDRQDIVQSALVKLVQNVSTLRALDSPALAAYIRIVVRNSAIDFSRRQAREAEHLWYSEQDADEFAVSDIPTMDERLENRELGTSLRRALEQLSDTDQRLLTGKYLLGETDSELAEAVGCSVDSVRMKLTRARRRAMKYMEKGGVLHGKTK